jgi:hypothetical protein
VVDGRGRPRRFHVGATLRATRLRATLASVGVSLVVAGCGQEEPQAQEGSLPPPATSGAEASATVSADPATRSTSRPAREPAAARRAPSTALLSAADLRSFARLEQRMGGAIGLAVGPLGASRVRQLLGSLRTGSAWSTIKLPIVVRVMADAGGPDALPSEVSRDIRQALTASDNAAAADLWASLTSTYGGATGAAAAVEEVLRDAGDRETRVSTRGRAGFSPYGQTSWSLASQQRFIAALAGGCTTAPAVTAGILSVMADVVPGQRWGLGSVGRPARFKGGWGPGTDGQYLVRQLGVLEYEGGAAAVGVAIAARAGDGSFADGVRALTTLARWTADHVDPDRVEATVC